MSEKKPEDKRIKDAITAMGPLVSDEEIQLLALACAKEGVIQQEDVEKALDWAQNVRCDDGILKAVLQGWLSIVGFGDDGPSFRLNERGRRHVDENLLPH